MKIDDEATRLGLLTGTLNPDAAALDHTTITDEQRAFLARPGDEVVKDHEHWVPSEFDAWGRGVGVGVIVEPPMELADLGLVDVRWPAGRCVEPVAELSWLGTTRQLDARFVPDDFVPPPSRDTD